MTTKTHSFMSASFSLMVAAMFGPAAALAQTPASQAGAAPTTLRLTIDEAVTLAQEHNLDLAVDRLEPQIGDTRVAQARSAYVPTFSTTLQRNDQLAPPTSFLVGDRGVSTEVFSSVFGVTQRLPWLGSSYAVSWDSSRTETDSPFSNFNPSLGSRLQMAFSQPLLKDFAIDGVRQQIITSERNRDIADTRFREQSVQTTADVKRAYWVLVSALAAVDVQQRSLELAQQLAQNNKARVDVGQMPPLDLLAAQAEVAQREENLIVAQTVARQAEDQLRTLIMDPESPDFWRVRIEPVERLPSLGPPPDVDAAITNALRDRSDLRRTRLEADNATTSVKYYENQRLPDLRFQANYLSNGVGGSRLLRSGGFPGAVIGTEQTSFGTVLDQLLNGAYPTWTVGFTLSYPIGRSFDEAGVARSRLEETQAKARIQSLEIRAARQIREAAWNIEGNAKRIDATRLARELAEQRLDAEQKRFDVGLSTSFLVVQAQRDLAEARNSELVAILAHERSVIDFEALQLAGPAQNQNGSQQGATGGGTAVAGVSGPVPPPTFTAVGIGLGQGGPPR